MSASGSVTVLAFDFGLRRIGVAIGNTLTTTARPLTTLAARNGVPDWTQISRIFGEYLPALCLVGIPYNIDGSEGPLGPRSRAFATELRERVGGEVQLVDERLSSRAAEESLRIERASGVRTRRLHKGDVDQMAATLILMQWLRRPGTGHG